MAYTDIYIPELQELLHPMKYLYIPFINGSKRALPTLLRCKLRRTAGRRAGRGRRRGGGRRDGGRCGLRQSYGIAGCAGLEFPLGSPKCFWLYDPDQKVKSWILLCINYVYICIYINTYVNIYSLLTNTF